MARSMHSPETFEYDELSYPKLITSTNFKCEGQFILDKLSCFLPSI